MRSGDSGADASRDRHGRRAGPDWIRDRRHCRWRRAAVSCLASANGRSSRSRAGGTLPGGRVRAVREVARFSTRACRSARWPEGQLALGLKPVRQLVAVARLDVDEVRALRDLVVIGSRRLGLRLSRAAPLRGGLGLSVIAVPTRRVIGASLVGTARASCSTRGPLLLPPNETPAAPGNRRSEPPASSARIGSPRVRSRTTKQRTRDRRSSTGTLRDRRAAWALGTLVPHTWLG